MKRSLASDIASTVDALKRCKANGNGDWIAKHEDHLDYIAKNFLPSGSGIDNGTKIDEERSNANKIVLHTSFHHMNEAGVYDGWTEHTVTITPSFHGVDVHIGGRNRNQIKDYLAEVFHQTLSEEREIKDWYDPKTIVA